MYALDVFHAYQDECEKLHTIMTGMQRQINAVKVGQHLQTSPCIDVVLR